MRVPWVKLGPAARKAFIKDTGRTSGRAWKKHYKAVQRARRMGNPKKYRRADSIAWAGL